MEHLNTHTVQKSSRKKTQGSKPYAPKRLKDPSHLSKFHHHMSKDVQETHNSIPQPAVSQRLLVTRAWTLKDTFYIQHVTSEETPFMVSGGTCKAHILFFSL